MRLVLDTNIVVSALLWRGTPHQIVAAAHRQRVSFFTSPVLLAELADVLAREKLSAALTAVRATPEQLMQRYQQLTATIHPAPIAPTIAADPDDDHVLACALAANASLVVSGDSHLLSLKTYRNIPIVTAAEALDRISSP